MTKAKECPEDRKMRLDAQRESKKMIGPFWRRHWHKFVGLVLTYADAEAEDKLRAMRDDFWGNVHGFGPPPRGAK